MLRFKDTLRVSLKKCNIGDDWETVAKSRVDWRRLVHDSVDSLEKRRVDYAGLKRAVRKQQPHHLIATANTFTCEICQRVLLSRAGYINHKKAHQRRAQTQQLSQGLMIQVHDVLQCNTPNCKNARHQMMPPNQCSVCGKTCKSKGGLTLHRKVHEK